MKHKVLLSVVAVVLLVAAFLFFGFGKSNKAEGEQSETANKTVEVTENAADESFQNVEVDKIWNITLDGEIDEQSIQNVKVLDADGKKVDVDLSLLENQKTLSIQPPDGGYTKGEYYQLIIEELKYANGDDYYDTFRVDFVITRDEVEEVEYSDALITISEEALIDLDEDNHTVSIESDTPIETDDVLVLPVDEGKAIKVTDITEKDDTYTIEYEEPRIADVIEEVDIYQTYSLTDDEIEIIPADNVEYEVVSAIPNDTSLASSSSKSVTVGVKPFDFESDKPSIKTEKEENALKFSLNNLPIADTGAKGSISITFNKPELLFDYQIKKFKLERLNFELTGDIDIESEFTFSESVSKKKEEKLEVPLGSIKIPIAYGGVVAYDLTLVTRVKEGENALNLGNTNLASSETTYEVSVTPSLTTSPKISLIKTKDTFTPHFSMDNDFNIEVEGSTTMTLKAGPEAQVGASFLGVLGVGLQGFGGAYAELETTLGQYENSGGFFMKYDCGALLSASIVIDTLKNKPLYEFELIEKKYKLMDWDSAEEVTDITLSPGNFENVSPGDEIKLKATGTVFNFQEGEEKDEQKFEKITDLSCLTFTSSDKDVVDIEVKRKKKSMTAQIYLKVNEKPVNNSATITVTYTPPINFFPFNTNTIVKEYNVTVAGLKEKEEETEETNEVAEDVSLSEAIAIYNDAISKVSELYTYENGLYDFEEGFQESRYPAFAQNVRKYATDKLVNGDLYTIAKEYNYYGSCMDYFPPQTGQEPINRAQISQGENTFTISFNELLNEAGYGGCTHTITMVNEDGVWKLDEIESSAGNFNLTKDEVQSYLGSSYTFIKEVEGEFPVETVNGEENKLRKLLIFKSDDDYICAIYTDDGEQEFREQVLEPLF